MQGTLNKMKRKKRRGKPCKYLVGECSVSAVTCTCKGHEVGVCSAGSRHSSEAGGVGVECLVGVAAGAEGCGPL